MYKFEFLNKYWFLALKLKSFKHVYRYIFLSKMIHNEIKNIVSLLKIYDFKNKNKYNGYNMREHGNLII